LAFLLYDTYGFPLELTEEIAAEAGVSVVRAGFDSEMDRQRERARASSKQVSASMTKNVFTELADKHGATPFDGYDADSVSAEVVAIVADGSSRHEAGEGEEAFVALSRTPFYAERGGQVGDRGLLSSGGTRFEVSDTTRPSGDLIIHSGRVAAGKLTVGMTVEAAIDRERRGAIRRHHTATHLLHEALCRVLGPHIRQAGSLVSPDFLRFDYNHFAPLTKEQTDSVERMICAQVLADKPVTTRVMNYNDARKLGVKALFEEKYGDVVRVLGIEDFSTELCGGTHAGATGQIGLVKILRDESIGAGVRRITAAAGAAALTVFQNNADFVRSVCEALETDPQSAVAKLKALQEDNKSLLRRNQELALSEMLSSAGEILKKGVRVGDVLLVAASFKGASRDMLRRIGDRLKQLEKDSVLLLAGIEGDAASLICMASDAAVKRGVHAGNLVKEISSIIGGSGGGKPSMGQGGGGGISRLAEALETAERIVKGQAGNPKNQ
jgi:alanyl-tRNA synthetase